ncbi:MAG: hypothetical protein NXI16_09285 [Alphaproteobacteria bacterium]|nr:hypothetical protein [Alphaproteobacteria bacterium]
MTAAYKYSGLVKRAGALLKRYGQMATVQRDVTTPDPAAPWKQTTTMETATVVAVAEDYRGAGLAFGFAPGVTILDGDKRVTCSVGNLTWDPAPPQRIELAGTLYRIIRLEQRLAPGGIPIAYVLQVRGAPA